MLLPHYHTNLPYYLPHTYLITTLSNLLTILFTTHLYYYHIIGLIYHTIYHTLVLLPHYQTNLPYFFTPHLYGYHIYQTTLTYYLP